MNSYIQLFCIVVSFFYGYFLYYFNNFNYKIIENKNILIKIIISILYVFNVSLVYVVFLYYINNGILHIYFILFIIIGYLGASVKKRKL